MKMIINLFSVFDPSTIGGLKFNWFSIMLGLIILPILKWRTNSRITVLINIIFEKLVKEIKPIIILKRRISFVIFSTIFFLLY